MVSQGEALKEQFKPKLVKIISGVSIAYTLLNVKYWDISHIRLEPCKTLIK